MNTDKHNVLVVDDEPDIREILCFNLEQAGYSCREADCGREALRILSEERIELVLLDIMMPGMSGLEVAEEIMSDREHPALIFLTALGEEADILHGFELGADDYIPKPFSLKLVLARVGAVLRRWGKAESEDAASPSISHGQLALYTGLKTATLAGRAIALTRMEYELLLFMLQHPRVVYSRAELLRRVWPDDGLVLERTVDVTINRLRKKIGPYRDCLKAKTGYGYYWEQ